MADKPKTSGKWGDLLPRVLSGVVLAIVGLSEIWLGGMAFALFAALATGLIGWEIARLVAPLRPAAWVGIGLMLAGGLLLSLGQAPLWTALVLLFSVLASVAAVGANGDRTRAVLYFGWVVVAGWGLIELRAGGMAPVFWLIGVVVATDIAGYFVGRMLGGPKFWPKVSPKKTWSGTVAGWVAAAIVGWLFVPALGAGIIWLSVIVSFASQMGDAAESALKRAKGVKDVSALIPGHGGVFDRFDAIMGAAFVVTLARLASLGG